MDIQGLIAALGSHLGKEALIAIKDLLHDLENDAQEPWKKTALALMAQAVATHGPQGVAPAMDGADLRTASDILAQMQQAEADQHSTIRDYLTKVSYVLGLILSGVIKGLVG